MNSFPLWCVKPLCLSSFLFFFCPGGSCHRPILFGAQPVRFWPCSVLNVLTLELISHHWFSLFLPPASGSRSVFWTVFSSLLLQFVNGVTGGFPQVLKKQRSFIVCSPLFHIHRSSGLYVVAALLVLRDVTLAWVKNKTLCISVIISSQG